MRTLEQEDSLPGELWDLARYAKDINYEIERYIAIGFVACIEGYFRFAYADLINHGSPFRENASKFDIKFRLC